MGKHRRKHRKRGVSNRPYVSLLLLTIVSLLLLIPLRGPVLSVAPSVAFLAALVLFLVPGAVLAGFLAGKDALGFPAVVPLAFTLSAGLFGLLALPFFLLRWSLDAYLLACGAMLVLSLAGALFLAPRGPEEQQARETSFGTWLLWAPLAPMTAAMAFASVRVFHPPYADTWSYLGFVRGFLTEDVRPVWGRYALNGWLFEQAALSRLTGLDPVILVRDNLAPVMIVASVLAFYWLARTLFEDEGAALLAACGATLFYLLNTGPLHRLWGSELVALSTEDKHVARFLFLPVALGLATLFVKTRSRGHLLLFALVCWSVVAVHPMGLALIGMSVTGFAFVHLTFNVRDRRAWISCCVLGAVMLAVVLPPAVYLLATGSAYASQLDGVEAGMASVLTSLMQDTERLAILDGGGYVMHPSFLLNPAMMAALLPGVPFLLWRARGSVTAQLLLGTLLFATVLLYLPPLTTFIVGIVGPWSLWRLTWPFQLAALLTLGWMAWELLTFLGTRVGAARLVGAAPFLPVLVIVGLMAVATPDAAAGLRSLSDEGEIPQEESACTDPAFRRIGETFDGPGAKALAADADNGCFPPFAPHVGYVTFRGIQYGEGPNVPQHVADVRRFFGAQAVDGEMLGILNRHGANLVLLHVDSPLNTQLKHLPGFTSVPIPGDRYRLYTAAPEELGVTPVMEANGRLNAGDFEGAVAAYETTLGGDEDERFLAYLGLGHAYLGLGQAEAAVAASEAAVALAPQEASAHALLADALVAAGDPPRAREAQEKAVSLAPRNVGLRFGLADLLQELGEERTAIDQVREVISMYPDVPEYRAELGGALARAGDVAAAERQFDRAITLDPLSPLTYRDVAEANEEAGRLREAAAGYEKTLRLTPGEPVFEYELGRVYYKLSTKWEDAGYSELAESHLRSVAENQDARDDLRANAYFFLGNLHRDREGPEKALAAYEEALKINPDLEQARTNLENLRRRSR